MADLLSTLPIELLSIIGGAITSHDVAALVLVNKPLNERLTPTLYASVSLACHDIARQCIRTLSKEPSALAFGRDLAAFIRSFSLWYFNWGKPPGKAKLARRLSRAIGRMTGLQHFTFNAYSLCSPNVCVALVRAAAPTLRSLNIRPDDEFHWADGSDAGVLRGIRAVFPELTSITLALMERQPWLEVFEPILTSRAGHLRKLDVSLSAAPMLASPLLCSAPAWPHLQELALGVPDAPLTTLPSTPNVRKLTLHSSPPAYALPQLVLPADAFPALEFLSCPYELLPKFLPANARRQRPIRTVRLNRAYFDEAGVGNGSHSHERPEWAAVLEALHCLPRSAGPVTDLSFFVGGFDAGVFGEGLAPYVAPLERLLVVVGEDPDRESAIATFGETLFVRAPRLRTFLLSDAAVEEDEDSPVSPWMPFSFARERNKQLGWLREWEEHTTALKTVAFTTEFVWTKTEDGWQPSPPKRLNLDSDDFEYDEDGDEELLDDDEEEDDDGSVDSDDSVMVEPH